MSTRYSLRTAAAASRCPRLLTSSALALAIAMVVGCSSLEAQDTASESAPPSGQAAPATAPAPSSSEPTASGSHATQIFIYPGKGQSAEQLDRDRYECYVWAVEQTGFDPSQPSLAPHQRVEVVAEPAPGADTVAGAVTGAVIGAVVSSPRHTGTGAAVGAVIGGVLGSASDAARAQEAREMQQRADMREAERLAYIEQQASNYRRALSACLEGRGYTVK